MAECHTLGAWSQATCLPESYILQQGGRVGRHRVKGNLKREVNQHPAEIWDDPRKMVAMRGNWNEHFSNGQPLHLELGMGRGRFMTQLTANHPEVNHIGMELKPDRCVTARLKILRKAKGPFLLLNVDGDLLPQIFAAGEVDRIYLNFPDPWPTWAYRERRMFGEAFLRLYQSLLKEGGELWFKTDQPQAWEEMLDSLPRCLHVVSAGRDLHATEQTAQHYLTEYERRYLENGASTHFARLVKRAPSVIVHSVTA
jgi:tRNA (guanine-N7-)-methyltransferase